MPDANQIRINELARELEVKARAILDYLPEAGVTEKKTHSSSIDVAAAEKVTKHFKQLAQAEADAEAAAASEKIAKEKKPKQRVCVPRVPWLRSLRLRLPLPRRQLLRLHRPHLLLLPRLLSLPQNQRLLPARQLQFPLLRNLRRLQRP